MNLGLNVISSVEDLQAATAKNPIVEKLVKAFCDEYTATHQYMIAKHICRGVGYADVVHEYEQHMKEEFDHGQLILKRLEQLGFKLSYDLAGINNGGNPWTPITLSLPKEQLLILINAERDAQAFYQEVIEAAKGQKDWITNRLFKQLQADECEHETDLTRIFEGL